MKALRMFGAVVATVAIPVGGFVVGHHWHEAWDLAETDEVGE